MTHKNRTSQTAWHRAWRWEIAAAFVSVVITAVTMDGGTSIRGYLITQVRDWRTSSMTIYLPAGPVTRSSSSKKAMTQSLIQKKSSSSSSRMNAIQQRKILRTIYFGGRASSSMHAAAGLAPVQGIQRATVNTSNFPVFTKTVFPVSQVPNWGAMHGAAEWGRSYTQMTPADFVNVPAYDLAKLTEPFKEAVQSQNEADITQKLFYSTKYYGAYDLDAGEYTWIHPGVDLKLALGTPIGTIAAGRIYAVRHDDILGLHVLIEHRVPGEGTLYSIYGHLGAVNVHEGQDVRPGEQIGVVGMTGNTSAPHLHLQVDRDTGVQPHMPYLPSKTPTPGEANKWTVHPIHFIEKYAQ
jgi:murein DD-endopeptidase MepM/ murein hydrolase activator NlpD